ncbi:hypothetical protein C2W64_03640 [Brevibacillus laterosporus]|nr:hypothetical protein C2W64_03640 [Brevibacillus laterosporus]
MNLMEQRISQGFAICYNNYCDVYPELEQDGNIFKEIGTILQRIYSKLSRWKLVMENG